MSDIRFVIIGAGLIFAGIILLSVFGSDFVEITIQAELGDCYEYYDDAPPTRINCEVALQDKTMFFALVALLIACGGIAMVKGIRGTWDQNVKPEDMVGPGSSFDTRDGPEKPDKKDESS